MAHQLRPFTLHLQRLQSYALFGPFNVMKGGRRSCVPTVAVLHKSVVYFHPETPQASQAGYNWPLVKKDHEVRWHWHWQVFRTFHSQCIYIIGQGSGSFYGRHFEGSHLHVLPFLPQANWLSQIRMWCPRWKMISSIIVVSFERYHVVNWLCCRSVSGSSEVQLQIPQGLSTIRRGGWIVWGDEGYTKTT